MTTCIRNGKMYQAIPDPNIECEGCAGDFDRPLCASFPDICYNEPSPGHPASYIWIEIKNEKPDASRSTSIRDKDLQVA